MEINNLKVTVNGPLWKIYEIEVENIDLKDKWEENADKGWVKLSNFKISDDELIDVYIKIGAPNGTVYKIVITGEIADTSPIKKIKFSKKYTVVRNGILRIQISEDINKLII